MSNTTRITQWLRQIVAHTHLGAHIRAPLTAIALFCAAAAIAPQAAAQACGNSYNLPANQWRMVGIPCVPPAGNETIGDVFGPSLGAANYGVTWIAWKRVYDDSQCSVPSGPSDCYIKLTLTSAATTGDAFWIYTTIRTSLQFGSTATSTPGPFFEFPAKLSTDGNSRYYMFTNPYDSKTKWRNVLFPAVVSGSSVVLTLQQAIDRSIVSKNVHYWNGNTYFTRDNEPPKRATFRAKRGVWLEMLQPDSTVSAPVSIRVPQP